MNSIATKKDYFWNAIGVFAQNAISPVLLIVVTRVNGMYDSGVFSYALAVALIFWAFSIWGGRTYQVSDLHQHFSAHSYVAVRIILGCFVLIGAVLFCVANNYDLVKSLVILVLVIFKVVESIADTIYGIMQKNGKLFITGQSLFIKSILGAALFTIVDVITKNLLVATLSILFVNIIVLIAYDLYYVRKLHYYISKTLSKSGYTKEALTIIKKCAPIATVLFLSMFSLNIPRYFLDRSHPDEIGYFGVLAMPITALALFIIFLLQPKVGYLSRLFFEQRYRELQVAAQRIMAAVIGFGLICLLVAYVAGIPLLEVIFGFDFSTYLSPLIVVMLGAIANSIVSVYISMFIIIRKIRILFYTLLITNICLIFVSFFVVEGYSIFGAVVVYTAINVIQASILAIAFKSMIHTQSRQSHLDKKSDKICYT